MKLNIAVCVLLAFCGIQSSVGYTLRDLQEVLLSLKPYIKGISQEVKSNTSKEKNSVEAEIGSMKQAGIRKVSDSVNAALADIHAKGESAESQGVTKNKVSICYDIAADVLQDIDINKHDEFEKIESVAEGLINGYLDKLSEIDKAKNMLLNDVDNGISLCALDKNLETCEKNVQSVTAAYRKYHDDSFALEKEVKTSLEVPVATAKSLNEHTLKSTQGEINNAKHVYEKCLRSN